MNFPLKVFVEYYELQSSCKSHPEISTYYPHHQVRPAPHIIRLPIDSLVITYFEKVTFASIKSGWSWKTQVVMHWDIAFTPFAVTLLHLILFNQFVNYIEEIREILNEIYFASYALIFKVKFSRLIAFLKRVLIPSQTIASPSSVHFDQLWKKKLSLKIRDIYQ